MAFDFKKEYAGGGRGGSLFSRPAAVKHLFLTSNRNEYVFFPTNACVCGEKCQK